MLRNAGKRCFFCFGTNEVSRLLRFKRCVTFASNVTPDKYIINGFHRNDARFFTNLSCQSALNVKGDNGLIFKTDNEVLDYWMTIDPKLINEENACSLLNHILHCHYKQLWIEHGHLHTSVFTSYLQLLVQAKLSKVMEPIKNHENFLHLCKILHENVDVIEIDKVITVLQTLTYLNVSPDNALIYKLIVRLTDDVNLNRIEDLSQLSHTVKCLPGIQCKLRKKSIDGVKMFVEENQNPTMDEVYHVANIAIDLAKFITHDTMVKIHDWLVKSIKSSDINGHTEHIGILMKLFYMCYQGYDIALDSEAMIILEKACLNNINSIGYQAIGEICRSLKSLKRFYGRFDNVMEKRALDLLSDDIRLPDLLSIMTGLSKSSSHLTKFEKILCSKLDVNESVDALMLSNISETLLDLQLTNDNIMYNYHKHVSDNAENIMSYISRFNKVSKLLTRKPFSDLDHENKFVQEVLKGLDGEYGFNVQTSSCFGLYLLSLKNFSLIPRHAHAKLISSLPRWDFAPLCKLFTYLSMKTSTYPRDKGQNILELLGRVQLLIAHKLNEDPVKNVLFLANSPSIFGQKNFSLSMSNAIINSLEIMAKSLDWVKLKKVLSFMLNTNYHVPEVFENIVNKVVSDMKNDDVTLDTLRVVSKANYRPLGMEQFAGLVMNIYKKKFENQEYLDCLHILSNLAYLQYFPKKELKEFFSVNVIEKLDELSMDVKSLEFLLMNLNRSVVIECPELGIPWFHEHYSQKLNSGSRFITDDFKRSRSNFSDEVFFSLIDVFGDSKFINRNTCSPYFNTIDFECVVDHSDKLIPFALLKNKFKKSYQRVAVCLHHESVYCKESKVLSANTAMQIRQLKMLSYKVLEVPIFDWYSMGMTENHSKVKYLKEKLADSGLSFYKK